MNRSLVRNGVIALVNSTRNQRAAHKDGLQEQGEAFWARSLIFILASILVPRLLGDIDSHDLLLLAILIGAAFAARAVVLFVLIPLLELVKLTQPISSAYKYAIIWGGLRGALTLVLALGVTENQALDTHTQRFVAVLATGFVLFTLFVNGTTLRLVIAMLGLHRLSPRNQVLRDRVLAVAYAEVVAASRCWPVWARRMENWLTGTGAAITGTKSESAASGHGGFGLCLSGLRFCWFRSGFGWGGNGLFRC
jgi:NhaP-type Na+/H+ or K+/H+ antiporter